MIKNYFFFDNSILPVYVYFKKLNGQLNSDLYIYKKSINLTVLRIQNRIVTIYEFS